MDNLINNEWIISLTSIVIGVMATPPLRWAGRRILSLRGSLSGTYLAMTQDGLSETLLVEVIRCQHFGDRVKGTITARAQFVPRDNGADHVTAAAATYRFTGRVRGRQILMNYWSTARASQNAGTMTLMLDADGGTLRGRWCGTATSGEVISTPCMWVRNYGGRHRRSIDDVVKSADTILKMIDNPWREPTMPTGMSKMLMFAALQMAARAVANDQQPPAAG